MTRFKQWSNREQLLSKMAEENQKMGLYDENPGKDTADYIDRHIVAAMIEIAKTVPSDEEIEIKADEYVENKWEYAQDECKETFTDGAKWMREQIFNQNK